jgi:type I restriction enzyme S subunit
MEIVCPSDDVLARYHRLVEPMFSEILGLFRQIQNLRRTRDLLLPRLLSGQVELETEAV